MSFLVTDIVVDAWHFLALTVTLLGSAAVCVFTLAGRRAAREQNIRLDNALNNMNQGLSMFDASGNLIECNRRYPEMYRLDATRDWRGSTIMDLLEARAATGTLQEAPEEYLVNLRAQLKLGKPFTKIVELADGRVMAVVNEPMQGGGWVATHEDITKTTRAQQELARTQAFLDTVVANVPTPMIVKSVPDLRFLLVNKAAERFAGMSAADMIGKTPAECFGAAAAEAIDRRDLDLLQSGKETFHDEHSFVTPSGDLHVVTSTRLPIAGHDGKPQYIITVLNDLTQRKRDEARIAYLAHHDAMTDLPNRTAFNECLNAMLDLAGTSREGFAVLCIDVDRFKAVNDTLGAPSGDALLRQLSARLQEACSGAFLARIGGDEFAVISPTGAQPATAEALAARLRAVTNADFEIDGNPISVGISIGVSIFPDDADDVTTLLANADAALYRAKQEARGSVCFFEADMDKTLRAKRALQHDLRQAIVNDELELYYQPQAEIDGTVTGFEALVRWHHPRQGMISPANFIPLAEESGLIVPLGEWVLRTACREAASWPRPLRIAVNLSPVQFQHGELVNLVHTTLLETGLSPSRLELEITEGVLIGDFSRGMTVLRRLKNMGLRVAMDDFGTGYSSLSYLQSFPFDKIKIDQVFIANLLHSPQSAAIVRAVIGLGHGLQLPVIAEGVETREQLEFLAQAGCNGAQGYLIGRPLPIAEYAAAVGRPGKLRLVAEAG